MVIGEHAAIEVPEGVVRTDVERTVAAPAVRIADPDDHRRDLLLRFGLGRRRHPAQRVDAFLERPLDVLHHAVDVGFRRRREVTVDVALADGVSEPCVEGSERTLVTGLLLRLTVELGVVVSEVRVVERLG